MKQSITVGEIKELLASLPTGSDALPIYIQPFHWAGRVMITSDFNSKEDDGAYIIGMDIVGGSSISNAHVFLVLGEGFSW